MRDTSAVRPGRGGVSQLPAGRAGAGPRVAAHGPARPAFPLRVTPLTTCQPGGASGTCSSVCVCTCVRCARVYVRNGPREGGGVGPKPAGRAGSPETRAGVAVRVRTELPLRRGPQPPLSGRSADRTRRAPIGAGGLPPSELTDRSDGTRVCPHVWATRAGQADAGPHVGVSALRLPPCRVGRFCRPPWGSARHLRVSPHELQASSGARASRGRGQGPGGLQVRVSSRRRPQLRPPRRPLVSLWSAALFPSLLEFQGRGFLTA